MFVERSGEVPPHETGDVDGQEFPAVGLKRRREGIPKLAEVSADSLKDSKGDFGEGSCFIISRAEGEDCGGGWVFPSGRNPSGDRAVCCGFLATAAGDLWHDLELVARGLSDDGGNFKRGGLKRFVGKTGSSKMQS